MLDKLLVGMSDEQMVAELFQVTNFIILFRVNHFITNLIWEKAQIEAMSREQTNKEGQRMQLKSGGLVCTTDSHAVEWKKKIGPDKPTTEYKPLIK